MKEWLIPLGFEKTGRNIECSFDRWQGDLHQHIGVQALDYNFVGLRPAGLAGFVSAERVFQHFRDGPLTGDEGGKGFAFAFRVRYEQLTRDPYKSYIVWTYANEEADVMAQLRHAVMEFIYAKIALIKSPDDLIDLQLARVGETDRFAVGVPGGPDDALRFLTLVRLYRPTIYADVRPRLQSALDWYQPVSDQVKRHLAYLDRPGELPPLPDRSAWAEWPAR